MAETRTEKRKKVRKSFMSENKALSRRNKELSRALKEKEELLEKLTTLDSLTGLPNWSTTNAFIERCLAKRLYPIGLLFIDFDNFKVFNHTYGYLLGDLLLAQFGKKTVECFKRDRGILGRLNGEAFVGVIPNATPESMRKFSDTLFAVTEGLTVNLHDTPQVKAELTISIGGVLWNGEGEMTSYALLGQADRMMRQAKKAGRNQYVFHQILQPANTGQNGKQEDMFFCLASQIRGALENGEFEPFYQPLYSVQDNIPVSAEALVRWRHPVYGVLEPGRFLPLFETSGLIVKLDLYMFECSCKNIRRWLDAGFSVVPVYCNFSRLHFLKDGFAQRLHEITEKYHVSSRNLGIEITENMLVEDAQPIIDQLWELRGLGYSVAMDDFGSGYSSFGMLQELPVNVIKLDRVFFNRDLQDFRNTSIICAITSIVKALGMAIVCEGIENEQQIAFLKGIGCDVVQGFYYARPMERSRFEELLQAGRSGCSIVEQQHTDAVRAFVEQVFTDYFVKQNFEQFAACIDNQVEWHDLFCGQPLYGQEEIFPHFAAHIRGKKFSLIYRSITPHHADNFIPVSGEAILVDEGTQPPFCRNFYFSFNCIRTGGKLTLIKFNMHLIRADSYVNLFRAQREIKINQDRHLDERALLDPYYSMLPLGIIRYELTADMVITYMNDVMFDIIGYSPEQFYGEMGGNLRQIVHPDDLNLIYQNSLKMIEGEKVEPFVYRFIRHDGSISRVLYYQCTVEAADHRPLIQSMYIWLDSLAL